MITNDQNIALLTVGNAALNNPDWTDYANYCFAREKGLRKAAFKHLDNFFQATANWTNDQKIEFIKFLFSFFETVEEADYGPFPQPLSERLVKPALQYWCEHENKDERPFRWYGTYYRSEGHLFKALELNPADDIARQRLLTWWTNNIYYSIHHLPEGYIGDPAEDLQLAEKIQSHIDQLTDPDLREKWTKELQENLELVRNYIEWKQSGHPDLEQWGKEKNKRVSYNLASTYYFNQ
ncbi:MAG TPA: hypothetical protein VD996_01175 [Chitinophagaceae bacterium]|nr:hypothetical protein [Chitinophagaceae bacterium]